MAKTRSRRQRSYRLRASNSHRRRSYARNRNPINPRRRYRRHRNPSMGGFIGELGGMILWGTGGAIASRALPQLLLGSNNTSFMGYAANLLTAFLGGGIVGRFAKGQSGSRFTAGGIIATGLRIFADYFGSYSQQFGLSGDLDFDLGFYIPNQFAVPTTGSGPYLLQPGVMGNPMAAGGVPGNPVAAVQAAAAAGGAGVTPKIAPSGGADEPSRWASRWAA